MFTPRTCPAKPTPAVLLAEGITFKSPVPFAAGEVSKVRSPVLVIAPLLIVPAKVAFPAALIDSRVVAPLAVILFAAPPVKTSNAPLLVLSLIEPLLSVHI